VTYEARVEGTEVVLVFSPEPIAGRPSRYQIFLFDSGTSEPPIELRPSITVFGSTFPVAYNSSGLFYCGFLYGEIHVFTAEFETLEGLGRIASFQVQPRFLLNKPVEDALARAWPFVSTTWLHIVGAGVWMALAGFTLIARSALGYHRRGHHRLQDPPHTRDARDRRLRLAGPPPSPQS